MMMILIGCQSLTKMSIQIMQTMLLKIYAITLMYGLKLIQITTHPMGDMMPLQVEC
ncbi:hypothetical protein LCGC14_2157810 [marine sediment metagenome]|uniref:Uncharacterized protein n=1 Tax=marine sediment metagenome TaxID=412755 RepID=A0A0F9DTT8_9ZZZZ